MPLSESARKQILTGAVDDATEVFLLSIGSESLFVRLWDLGLFRRINLACGTLIDDYESEWLEPEQIPLAAREVNKILQNHLNGEVGIFLQELSELMERAAGSQLPLLFEC